MDLANVQLPSRSHAEFAASHSNEERAVAAAAFRLSVPHRRSHERSHISFIRRAAAAVLTSDFVSSLRTS